MAMIRYTVLMKNFPRLFRFLLHFALLHLGNVHAAPPADQAALVQMLGKPSRIEFIVDLARRIDGLDVEKIPELRSQISDLTKQSDQFAPRVADAIAMIDRHWARKSPRTLLDAAATQSTSISVDNQAIALHRVLDEDMEAAIGYYFRIPLYEDFGRHNEFYEKLSAIDAPRAVRLYFESADKNRIFLNPLETAFEAWGKKDMDAAWAEAMRITDSDKRKNILILLGIKIAKSQADKLPQYMAKLSESDLSSVQWSVEYQTKDKKEKPTPPPAPPAPDKAALAREEAALEKFITEGYYVYSQSEKVSDADMTDLMYRRYPERALIWLEAMPEDDSYAWNRYRDLAEKWPREKRKETVDRVLKGKRYRDLMFGILLGNYWIKDEPAEAVPYLFSMHPRHGQEWRNYFSSNFSYLYKTKGEATLSGWIDEIKDSYWRDIMQRDLKLESIRALSAKEALAALMALEHPEDIQHFKGFEETTTQSEMNHLIMALGPEHVVLRDHWLSRIHVSTFLSQNDPSISFTDVITALKDPELRQRFLSSIFSSVSRDVKALDAAPLLEILAQLPPGFKRDESMKNCIDKLTSIDRLALIEKTQSPALRAQLAIGMPSSGWDDANFARCLAIIESLPPPWLTQEKNKQWENEAIGRLKNKPLEPADLAQALRQLFESKGSFQIDEKISAWRKKDPQAFLAALDASGTFPQSVHLRTETLLLLHGGDHRAAYAHLRSNPVAKHHSWLALFSSWAESDILSAAAASLSVNPRELRHRIIERLINRWCSTDLDEATKWIQALPISEERTIALQTITTHYRGKNENVPAWLEAVLPPEPILQPPGNYDFIELTEKQREEQRQAAEHAAKVKEKRKTTMAVVRTLAALDEAEAIISIKKLPKGEHKINSQLGLLAHAAATGNDALRQEMLREITTAQSVTATEIAEQTINNFPQESIARAIDYLQTITDPQVHKIALDLFFERWSAPQHQESIVQWIRNMPDLERRMETARHYLHTIFTQRDQVQSPMPDFEPVLRDAVQNAARAEIIHALLDRRKPYSGAIDKASLDEETKNSVQRQFDQLPAH